jgi:hypothetical protein
MSNINATLQSNLVLPVVDSLPASGTVGTQFVYQNNVYVFDSGGLPVRVGLPAYRVVTELPETLAVGDVVLFNGTTWRGLLAGESSLPTGTPWPVKGYKEWSGVVTVDGATVVTNNIIKSDFDVTFSATSNLASALSASINETNTTALAIANDATIPASLGVISATSRTGGVDFGYLDFTGGGYILAKITLYIRVYA